MFNLPIRDSLSIFRAGNTWAVIVDKPNKGELPFDPAEFVKKMNKGHDPILSQALDEEEEIQLLSPLPFRPAPSSDLFLFKTWEEVLDFLKCMEERQ